MRSAFVSRYSLNARKPGGIFCAFSSIPKASPRYDSPPVFSGHRVSTFRTFPPTTCHVENTARHHFLPLRNPPGLLARALLGGRDGGNPSLALRDCYCLAREHRLHPLVQSPGPVPQDVADCRQLSQRAVGALHRGDIATAESLAQRACRPIRSMPKRIKCTAKHCGVPASAKRRSPEAQQAQKLLPDDPLVTVRLGEQYQEQGRSGEAAELASQAIDLCPNCASAWALRARARASLGQLKEALPDFQQALRFQPTDQKLLLELAELHRRMNRPERAPRTLGFAPRNVPPTKSRPSCSHSRLTRWPRSNGGRRLSGRGTQLAQRMPRRKLAVPGRRAKKQAVARASRAQLSMAEAERLAALGPPLQNLPGNSPALPGNYPNLTPMPAQIARERGICNASRKSSAFAKISRWQPCSAGRAWILRPPPHPSLRTEHASQAPPVSFQGGRGFHRDVTQKFA